MVRAPGPCGLRSDAGASSMGLGERRMAAAEQEKGIHSFICFDIHLAEGSPVSCALAVLVEQPVFCLGPTP